MDMSVSKLQKMVKDREAWRPAIHGSQRVRHDWATEQHTHPYTVSSHLCVQDESTIDSHNPISYLFYYWLLIFSWQTGSSLLYQQQIQYQYQFSESVVTDSLRPHAHQASLSITVSWSLFKLMSIESVMPSNHLILCCLLLLLRSVFPSIRVFFRQHQVLLILGREILLPLTGKKKSHSFSCVDIDFLFGLAARKLQVSVDWLLVTSQDFMECIVLSGSVLLYFLSKQTFLADP